MIGRVLFVALVCGVAAGLFMSAVQAWKVTPLIIAAEAFEGVDTETHAHDAAASTESASEAHAHDDADGWAPADGLERTVFTILSNVIAAVAFSLVLTGVIMLIGFDITLTRGVLLGFAGFAAVSLAPAAGLSPELPGMPAAELLDRQIWWWGTVVATALGIAVLALVSSTFLKGGGALLIALPHLVGAPQPEAHASAVPAHLAAQFAANSLATAAVFWVVLGALLGWTLSRASQTSKEV